MAEAAEEDILVLRNLKDAGCDTLTVEKFLQLKEARKTKEQLRLLSCHRNSLLQKVHENQKKIDCLDFLIFSMKQKEIR